MNDPAFSLLVSSEVGEQQRQDAREGHTHIERMGMAGIPISSKSFLKALKNDLAPEVGLLPSGVRFVSATKKIWLFERAPETITINYALDMLDEINDDTARTTYSIHLPWIAYLVELDQTYYPDSIFVFAMEHSLQRVDDKIGVLPLSNFSTGGKLCQPHRGTVEEVPTNIGEGLQLAYQMVWSSGFNRDLDANFSWCRGLRKPFSIFLQENRNSLCNFPWLLTAHWETMSDDEIESIEDWPPPRHFDKFLSNEDIDEMRASGDSMREGNRIYYRTIGEVLEQFNISDLQRYGDWDSGALQRLFQSAMSQAGLYE